MINKIKNSLDFDFNMLILLAFFSSRMLTKILSIFLGVKGVFITMILLAIMYVIGIVIKIKEKDYNFIFFFTIFFGLLFLTSISYYFNNEIGYWLTDKDFGFLIKVFNVRDSISALLVILLVNDKNKLLKGLEIIAYINALYLLIQIIVFYKVGHWNNYFVTFESEVSSSYNMNLGYDLIFISFISLAAFLRNPKKVINAILGVFAMAYAIVFGSRGVLVLIAAFIFLYIIFFFKELKEDKRIKKSILIIIGVFVLTLLIPKVNKYFADINSVKFKEMAQEEKEKYELEFGEIDKSLFEQSKAPRNLEMIKDGEFFQSNGRTSIWKYGIEAFKDSPIIGHGVFGDRPYVGQVYSWGYSHNIAIELASNFGLLGIGLGLAIVGAIIYTFIRKDRDTKYLFLVFSAMLSKLLLSDSFYFSYIFWSTIALIYLTYLNKKDKYKLNLYLSIAFLLGTILVSAISIKKDYNNQDFKHIKFARPTVAIAITEHDEKYLHTIVDELNMNNLAFSFFEDPVNKNYEKILKKDVDLQDYKKESISYRIKPNEKILDDLYESKNIRKKLDKKESSAMIAPYYAYSSSINYFLKDKKLFLINFANNIATYSHITDSNRLYLKANQISIKHLNHEKNEKSKEIENKKEIRLIEKTKQFDDLIKKIKDNKNFAILDFKLLDDENMRLFRYALSSLKYNHIDTLNFSDIEKKVTNFRDDVDYIENLIKNSRLTYFIKGFLK